MAELNLFGTGLQACIADMVCMYRCCWITSFTNWLSWRCTLDLANEYMCSANMDSLNVRPQSHTLQQMQCKRKSIPTIHNTIFSLPAATPVVDVGRNTKFVRYNSNDFMCIVEEIDPTRSSQSVSLACIGSFCICTQSRSTARA